MKAKVLREWRLVEVTGGSFCFFDPRIEKICVYPLTSTERCAMVDSVSCEAVEAEADAASQLNNKQRDLFLEVPTF